MRLLEFIGIFYYFFCFLFFFLSIRLNNSQSNFVRMLYFIRTKLTITTFRFFTVFFLYIHFKFLFHGDFEFHLVLSLCFCEKQEKKVKFHNRTCRECVKLPANEQNTIQHTTTRTAKTNKTFFSNGKWLSKSPK